MKKSTLIKHFITSTLLLCMFSSLPVDTSAQTATATIDTKDITICGGPTNISGTVSAIGFWTLTLSDGSSTFGVGVSSWTIQVAPGSTTIYSIASLVNGSLPVLVGGSETVTINHVTSGSIGSDQVVCPFGIAAPLTSPDYGSADGTIGWVWQVSNDNFSWVNIPGANSATYTDPNPFNIIDVSADRYYRRFTISILNGVQCNALSNVVHVYVNVVTAGSIATDQTICSGQTPATIVSTAPGTYRGGIGFYQWSENDGTGWVDIPTTSSANYSPGPLSVTTKYRRAQSSALFGITCIAYSNEVTITVNTPVAIAICPGSLSIEGCSTVDITPTSTLPYSVPAASITLAQFNAEGGVIAPNSCDIASVFYQDVASGTCPITIKRTFTLTDVNSHTATCNQTITIHDNTAPTVTAPGTSDLECESDLPPAITTITGFNALTGAATSDNCTPTENLTVTSVTGPLVGTNCGGTITRTYTITDACNNATSVKQVFAVSDNTKPIATAPVTSDLECESDLPAAVTTIAGFNALAGATASDNCTATANLAVSSTTGTLAGTSCNGSITRAYTITDACGNATSVDQVFTITDNTRPIVTAPATSDLECASDLPAAVTTIAAFNALAGASASDNCTATGNLTLTSITGALVGNSCNGTITRTYTITDACNNATSVDHVFTVTDNTKPVITLATATALECNPTPAQIAAAFGEATVINNCSTGLIATGTLGAETESGCAYSTTKSWTVTDDCGNTQTATQTITYKKDAQKPVITLAAATAPGCNPTSAQIAAAFGEATVSDNCSAALIATGTIGSETGSGCIYATTKSWTVTDDCGNTQTASQTITYKRDIQKPVITLAAATVLGCNPTPAQIAAAFGGATVSDNCSIGLIATSTIGSETGSGCTYSTTKSWTVTDDCGNYQTASQTVTYKKDTQKPVITIAPAIILGCNPTPAQIAASFGGTTVTDNCSTELTATGIVGSETGSACTYATTKTWTVTDDCGNAQTASQTVTYKRDTQKPVITLAAATAPGCNPTAAKVAAAFGGATVSDNCSTGLIATGTIGLETGSGCSYSTTKSWTVTDACGNTQTASQTVTYKKDIQKPVISNCPSNIITCNSTVSWTVPTASDNCGVQSFTSNHNPGQTFAAGTTTITYTATDACGNNSTCNFTVTVNTALIAGIISGASSVCAGSTTTYTISGNSISGTWSSSNTAVATVSTTGVVTGIATGTATIKYTVTNSCGSKYVTKSITVTSNVPIITCPSASPCTRNAGITCKYTISGNEFNATASCSCGAPTLLYTLSGATSGTGTSLGGVQLNKGLTTITWKATIGSLSRTCSITVTVNDNQPPVITCKPRATRTVSTSTYTVSGTEFNATASDNCGTPSLLYCLSGATVAAYSSANISLAGKKLNVGSTTIMWRATDGSDNVSTCATVVTVSHASYFTQDIISKSPSENRVAEPKSALFTVRVIPNPTSNYFTLQLHSKSYEKFTITITDITGRLIEQRLNVSANTIQLGNKYHPGVYIAEILQGKNKVILRLIKEGN